MFYTTINIVRYLICIYYEKNKIIVKEKKNYKYNCKALNVVEKDGFKYLTPSKCESMLLYWTFLFFPSERTRKDVECVK